MSLEVTMSTEDKMTIDERRKYLRKMKQRCLRADREGRRQLLDEMEAVTELHPPDWKPQESDPADERKPGAQRTPQATRQHIWGRGFVLRLSPKG